MINTMTNIVLPGMRFTIDGENGINICAGIHDRIYYTDGDAKAGFFKFYNEYPKIHFLRDWDYVFCYAEAIEGNGKFIRFFVYADKEFKKFYYDQSSYESMTHLYDINHVKLISIISYENVLYENDLSNETVLKEIVVDEFHPNIHELFKIGDDTYLTNYITINEGIECYNINNEHYKKYVTSYEPIKTSRFLIAGGCSYNGKKKMWCYDSLLNKYYLDPSDEDDYGKVIINITEVEVNEEHPLFIIGSECKMIPLLDDNELNAKIISIPLYYSYESLEGFNSNILKFYKSL